MPWPMLGSRFPIALAATVHFLTATGADGWLASGLTIPDTMGGNSGGTDTSCVFDCQTHSETATATILPGNKIETAALAKGRVLSRRRSRRYRS